MTRNRFVSQIAPFLPGPLKLAVHGFLKRRERRNVNWLRDAAGYVAKNFIDEIVLCPNGEVYDRDEAGPEFLVPIHLGSALKVGATTWEALESKLLIANSGGDSPVMLDVGANVGLHSIRVAWARPSARLFAFEPVTANYAVMRKNILRNRLESRIESVHAAVGAKDGAVSISAGYGTGNWVGATDSRHLETVPVVSIDSFVSQRALQRVTVIKADVEGYELQVLRGAHKCLAKLRPKLLLEIDKTWSARFGYQPPELFAFLRRLDYDYVRITKGRQVVPPSGDLSQDLEAGNNFFFFPRETSFYLQ